MEELDLNATKIQENYKYQSYQASIIENFKSTHERRDRCPNSEFYFHSMQHNAKGSKSYKLRGEDR